MNKCGQCRQFSRMKTSAKDLCGAWEQPTNATRKACDFFLPKNQRDSQVNVSAK